MEGLSACECPVCFLLLNHTSHEPMSMPCGHTLCKVCVVQLGERATPTASRGGHTPQPTFQCPICRQWINSSSISLNVTLRDLLAELGRMEEKRLLPLGTALNVGYSEVDLEEVLDRGAFGEVCRGRWRGNDVALKLFSTGRPTPEAMEAFRREVFVMNCLRHPNVVLLLGACQTPPKLAIIMEFVAGGSLHQLIHVDKRSLAVPETASLATDICRGLQYLHSINVLHRDLKSKNVLLTGPIPCQAKLCDFGLSRMRQESATMTGNIGTVHWTAPEVLNNERYKFSADVYGFGMVLYEMVSGRVPLGHMVPMAVMLAVAVRRERPSVPDNAHPVFRQLITNCSQWVPDDRPSLPSILSSLTRLLPHPQTRGVGPEGAEPAGKERGSLQHQDSLGVVFLSATDSADLSEQDPSLPALARLNQAQPTIQTTPLAPPKLISEEQSSLNMAVAANPVYSAANPGYSAANPGYSAAKPGYSAANPGYSAVDRESERTSLNMVVAMQQPRTPWAPSPAPRKTALGEGSAPWPHKQQQQQQQQHEGRSRWGREGEEEDEVMARQIQAKLDEALVDADRELAEQLQMKENSFMVAQATNPKARGSSVFPPQPLLDTIKSKKFPQLKKIKTPSNRAPALEATPTETTPTEGSLKKKLGSLISRNVFRSSSPHSSWKPARKSAVPPSITAHPPPPPPPPLPLSRQPRLSPRQVMLKDVRAHATTVARKLRPVQTVEKRAFRVGHVVGDYNSQRSLYTTQNLVESFNRQRLRPVTVHEPPPPFPVGRVVPRREKVKRMSSNIEQAMSPVNSTTAAPPLPPLPPSSPPRRRLHPAIRVAVEKFSRGDLHHVETVVRQRLPDKEELEREKALVEDEKRAKLIEELLEFDRSLLVTVDTAFKNRLPSADVLEIERRQAVDSDLTHTRDLVLHSVVTFDRSGLHHVVTQVKNHLPSIGTIELERSQQGQAATADSEPSLSPSVQSHTTDNKDD